MKLVNFYSRILLLLAVILLLISCGEEKKNVPSEKSVAKPEITVAVLSPLKEQPHYSLDLPGELKAYEEVALYPKVKGFVKHILVDRGTKVFKGQLLAVLEAPEISQQYLAAKSDEHKFYEDYLYSRQAYDRLKKAASKSGAVAEIELDRARSKFRSDSAAFASVKAKTGASAQLQQYLRIIAPFDGIVTAKNVSVGALVGEGGQLPILSIAQTKNLRLTIAIPEIHAQSINDETKVSFTVKNHPGKTFQSKLSRKSGFLSQESRSISAEFDVKNDSGILGGGEYAQVKVNMVRPAATLWLPATSIVNAQSGIFVLKVADHHATRIPVQVGIRRGDLQEVFGELSPADQIIKIGSEEIAEGARIIIK